MDPNPAFHFDPGPDLASYDDADPDSCNMVHSNYLYFAYYINFMFV